jgi:hypothetical protein
MGQIVGEGRGDGRREKQRRMLHSHGKWGLKRVDRQTVKRAAAN